jgi:hypothetical protein
MRIIQLISIVAILALGFSTSHGAEKVSCDDMGTTSVNNFVLNDDGTIDKITAIGEGVVDFADDPDDIQDAREIAELEARKALSIFMSESLKSDTGVNNIANKIREGSSAGKKVSKKKMITKIKKIHQSSQALLKGVVALEECYDNEKGEYRVMVGTSTKTMRAADSLRQKSHEDALSSSSGSGSSDSSGSAGVKAETGESSTKKIESFRRKSKMDF